MVLLAYLAALEKTSRIIGIPTSVLYFEFNYIKKMFAERYFFRL